MSNYDNTNRGALFRQEEKKSEKHPDYKGEINIEGVDYWISGWIKPYQNGTKRMLSLSAEPKQRQEKPRQRQDPARQPRRGQPDPAFDDDDPPF